MLSISRHLSWFQGKCCEFVHSLEKFNLAFPHAPLIIVNLKVKNYIYPRLHPKNINSDSGKGISEARTRSIKKHDNRWPIRQRNANEEHAQKQAVQNYPITAKRNISCGRMCNWSTWSTDEDSMLSKTSQSTSEVITSITFTALKKNVIYHKGHLISLLYYALLHFLYLVVIIAQGCDCWKGGNNMSKKEKKWLHRETNDDALK